MTLIPITTTSDSSTVDSTARQLTLPSATALHLFTSSTNCWIKQGSCALLTCATMANFTDGDYYTIVLPDSTKVYEIDKAGNGVTSGRVQVNISAATTAAECAAILRTAILASQAYFASGDIVDNANGTLTIMARSASMTVTENVTHASGAVASAVPTVSAADGSMYVPANYTVILDGALGLQVGVLRNTADGAASVTQTRNV